jgi:SP family xylose:H+ symportor-like MFS transporter
MNGKGNTSLLAALTLAATLGGLLFGYDTGVIAGVTDAITHNFVLPRHLSQTDANLLSGLAISIALLGCVIGALLAGPMSTRAGRKGGMIITGVLFLLSSLGAGYPEFFWSVFGGIGYHALPAFMGYRLLAGMAIGMASMLAPLYIAEVAPPASRGMLVTFQQIAIVAGFMIVDFVNWGIQAGHTRAYLMTTAWRHMLASAAVPATLLILCMLLVPETPRFMVLKDRDVDALALLERLVGEADAGPTLRAIKATLSEHTRPLLSFGALVLFVGILLSMFQQLVGINAVLYYAPHMFENMGVSTDQALWDSAVYSGVTMTVSTLIATFTVDRIGRKPLLIAGAFVMAAGMLLLGSLFDRHQVAGAALGAIVLYITGFSFSWGPVVWVILSEIFPNSIRGKAMSVAVAAQWIMNFVVSTTFSMMDGSSTLNARFNHGFAYWVYGGFSVLAALFVIRFVPETRGQPLESIQQLWHRHRKLDKELVSLRAAD